MIFAPRVPSLQELQRAPRWFLWLCLVIFMVGDVVAGLIVWSFW